MNFKELHEKYVENKDQEEENLEENVAVPREEEVRDAINNIIKTVREGKLVDAEHYENDSILLDIGMNKPIVVRVIGYYKSA